MLDVQPRLGTPRDIIVVGCSGDLASHRLLHDAMLGDHTLFISESEIERAWEILHAVMENPPPVVHYAAGSRGPKEAERLVDPRRWHALED